MEQTTLQSNTIFALATAPGRSGVAIVRLSGPQALAALRQLSGRQDFTPRMAHYVELRAHDTLIDRALALYFPAPHSFTGEDVAELHIHGGLAVIRQTLEALSQIEGLRPAEPGEFSRRSFLNGKMDLTEAEGLADLIAAETPMQKAQALRQMEGGMSAYYDHLRTGVIRVLAHLEAYIDFPDEEIPDTVLSTLEGDLKTLQEIIREALADGRRGERIRDGIHVVILGAPNVGKSSLLNALARRDAAIVSSRAGTTRDIIEVHMDLAGFPVILSDTAGIRDTADDIEEEGVRRAQARARQADIRLVLFDGVDWPQMDGQSRALLADNAIAVVSKCDLCHPERRAKPEAEGSRTIDKDPSTRLRLAQDKPLFISTKTGQGVEALLAALERRISAPFSSETAPLITRQRHRALLAESLNYLEKAMADKPLELKCEELRRAALAIGKITGKIQVDDVLDVIFGEFCIGK